jgi:hypothetical protein
MGALVDVRKKLYAGLTIATLLSMYSFPLVADAAIKKVILLQVTGGQPWTVPADFNSYDNTIEVIGGGGGESSTAGASGGGGAAYMKSTNVNLVGTTSVYISRTVGRAI